MKEKSAYEERCDVVEYLRTMAESLEPGGDPRVIVRLLAARIDACRHLLVADESGGGEP